MLETKGRSRNAEGYLPSALGDDVDHARAYDSAAAEEVKQGILGCRENQGHLLEGLHRYLQISSRGIECDCESQAEIWIARKGCEGDSARAGHHSATVIHTTARGVPNFEHAPDRQSIGR